MQLMNLICRVGRRRFLIAVLLTVVILCMGGNSNPDPVWSHDFTGGKSQPMGITRRGELVALEEHPSRSCLTVYEVSSGRMLLRHTVPSNPEDGGMLTPDGERVVLFPVLHDTHSAVRQYFSPSHLAVVRISDGKTLLDDYEVHGVSRFSDGEILISPDGRYVEALDASGHPHLYDMEAGKLLWYSSQPLFSPDSKSCVELNRSWQATSLRLRSMEDGHVIGKFPLPFKRDTNVTLKSWVGDRLEFWVTPLKGELVEVHSFTLRGQGLGEVRREPDGFRPQTEPPLDLKKITRSLLYVRPGDDFVLTL